MCDLFLATSSKVESKVQKQTNKQKNLRGRYVGEILETQLLRKPNQ